LPYTDNVNYLTFDFFTFFLYGKLGAVMFIWSVLFGLFVAPARVGGW